MILLKNFFDNATFELQCPKCRGKFQVSVNQVGSTIQCKFCHQPITLQNKGFTQGLQQANKDIDKFLKNL